jgi:hypothetical protein
MRWESGDRETCFFSLVPFFFRFPRSLRHKPQKLTILTSYFFLSLLHPAEKTRLAVCLGRLLASLRPPSRATHGPWVFLASNLAVRSGGTERTSAGWVSSPMRVGLVRGVQGLGEHSAWDGYVEVCAPVSACLRVDVGRLIAASGRRNQGFKQK